MPVKTVRLYTLALILGDLCAVLAAFGLAYVIRVQYDARPLAYEVFAADFLQTFLILMPFWFLTFLSLGLYSPAVYQKRLTECGKVFIAAWIGILVVIGYAFVVNQPVFPARLVAVYAVGLLFIFLIIERELLRQVRDLMYLFGRGVQRVLIIGNNDATADIAESLSITHRSGYRVVAIAGKANKIPGAVVYRSYEKALADLDTLRIDTIIQTNLFDAPERNQQIMSAAQTRHIQYCFIPGETEFYSGKNTIDIFLGYPIINVYQTPLIGWGEMAKRVFDLTIIALSAVVWLPFMLIVMLLQKLLNPGPIFFMSKRLGLHGKTIHTYKFRSMAQKYSGESAEKIFRTMGRDDLVREYEKHRKVENDPRITRFGNLLRITSIDEIPQIFNVIRGDMSLVGPRPIIREEKAFYKSRAPLLFSVRPGITGLWQVSGRSDLSFAERVELELYYAQNWSFMLDLRILLKTIGVVLFRRGAR